MNYKKFNTQSIASLDKNYRAQLINTLIGVKPLVLIGTLNEDGTENLGVFSSLFHVGSNPSLCGLVFRPNEVVQQHTFQNILRTGFYTINHVPQHLYEQAHKASAKYPMNVSEFEILAIKKEYINEINLPFVADASVKFYCKLAQQIPVPLNGTTIVLGSIEEIFIKEALLQTTGHIIMQSPEVMQSCGLDSYYRSEFVQTLPYAKL
jgi:flavin reductase (DIM6/NTAB) family NADH-FMN oxidoreductase RutF